MDRPFVTLTRSVTAALLLLAMLVGTAAGAIGTAAQDGDEGTAAVGTVVPDMITVQGIVAQDDDRAGTYEYLLDVTASADVADDYRIAGAGEQVYLSVDSATNLTIDVAETDASGVAVLDGQVGASFYVYEIDDLDGGGIPIGTNGIFLPANDPNPAVTMTGIFYVASPGPSVEPSIAPSVEPSIDPSTEPLPSGTVTGTILPDAISIQGIVVEDAERAGETDYLINVTSTAEVGDYRAAFAGEQTYQVVDLNTNQVIDSGSTDANGQVLLDGEVDAEYYVVEVNDTGAIPGTDSLFYAAGDPNAFIALTGIVYVSQVLPSPSPAAQSPSPVSPSPSPIVSESPVASPSEIASPSAAASLAASVDPSPGDPAASGPGQTASAAPDAVVAGDGIAGPSAAASRPAAPVISDRDDVGALPNTGAGSGGPSTPGALLVSLLAIAALLVAGTAVALRRRVV